MEYMLYHCNSLSSSLNLSSFITQNVVNMKSMFFFCNSLSSLNLSNFDNHNLTNMESMLCGCESLSSLDLSNINT